MAPKMGAFGVSRAYRAPGVLTGKTDAPILAGLGQPTAEARRPGYQA